MIRPVTCVCFILACGSGLYLYQSKHRVQVLDHEIEKTVRTTDELREQARVLHAEWTLQNDPQRLQALADQFLTLKTVAPGQFTSLADLDGRLPAVRAPDPVPPPAPVVQAPGTTQPEEPQPPPVAAAPVPPPPPPKPAVVALSAPPHPAVERKLPPPPPPVRPVLAEAPPPPRAEAQPARIAPIVSRPAVVAATPPRPVAPVLAPTSGGSALGMARSAAVPPPMPMPVSASQWVGNGGGGN